MRIQEVTGKQPRVMAFRGLSHGREGNQALAALTRSLGGEIFDHSQGQQAQSLILKEQPELLVLIGYSAGAATVMQLNDKTRPRLSILIAGYPTTLLRLEGTMLGEYVNYYQQRELDGILRSRGLPAYRPQGGTPVVVDADHNSIVTAVTTDILRRVRSL